MKINWIFSDPAAKKETKALIDKEFELRTSLYKILLKDSFLSNCDDFDRFVFNYHIETNKLVVSSKTPEPYHSKLKRLLSRYPIIHYDNLGDLRAG